ncbi:hypothetical protein N7463_000025 [Penicillium fimorum]|uniref:Uncharacterized protein n=1 Tax=Penicillium fimorum TaxID=1882269 RepID=A0A9W9Y3F7_9EURO|nr:hypothetical protein N7463_000025 [Penicillium fimorum]
MTTREVDINARRQRESRYIISEGPWPSCTMYLMLSLYRYRVTEPGCMLKIMEGGSELGVAT